MECPCHTDTLLNVISNKKGQLTLCFCMMAWCTLRLREFLYFSNMIFSSISILSSYMSTHVRMLGLIGIKDPRPSTLQIDEFISLTSFHGQHILHALRPQYYWNPRPSFLFANLRKCYHNLNNGYFLGIIFVTNVS